MFKINSACKLDLINLENGYPCSLHIIPVILFAASVVAHAVIPCLFSFYNFLSLSCFPVNKDLTSSECHRQTFFCEDILVGTLAMQCGS